MKIHRIAIIGCGMISKSHIPAISSLKNARLTAVCDVIEEKARAAGEKAGVPFYVDAQTMLEAMPEIDVCLIATPTYTHPALVTLCASYGKAVLGEKPIAVSKKGAEEISAAVSKYRVPYMTAQVVRFWCGYVKMKEMIDNGEFGKIYMSYFSRDSEPQHWDNDWLFTPKLGGGAMYDMLVHDVDYMEYLFGHAESVYAHATKDDSGCYENVYACINYENGIKGVAETSFTMAKGFPFSMHARIIGSKATAEFHYRAGYSINDRDGAVCTLDIWRENGAPEHINVEQYNAYAAETAYFLDCIDKGTAPAVITPEDSVNVIHTINALEVSADNGTPVALADVPDRIFRE